MEGTPFVGEARLSFSIKLYEGGRMDYSFLVTGAYMEEFTGKILDQGIGGCAFSFSEFQGRVALVLEENPRALFSIREDSFLGNSSKGKRREEQIEDLVRAHNQARKLEKRI